MTDPLLYMKIREGKISNTFGMVRTNTDGTLKPHQGWDLQANLCTQVFAVAKGTIVWTRADDGVSDYGNQVLLAFSGQYVNGAPLYGPFQQFFAFYAHLTSFIVKPGQLVEEGELIASTGQSGNAGNTPPHLHFEIRSTDSQTPGTGLGSRIDPATFLGAPPLAGRSVPGYWGPTGYIRVDDPAFLRFPR